MLCVRGERLSRRAKRAASRRPRHRIGQPVAITEGPFADFNGTVEEVLPDKGKVRALPTAAGTYRGLGIAEQVGLDGQLVLIRPALIGNITVSA